MSIRPEEIENMLYAAGLPFTRGFDAAIASIRVWLADAWQEGYSDGRAFALKTEKEKGWEMSAEYQAALKRWAFKNLQAHQNESFSNWLQSGVPDGATVEDIVRVNLSIHNLGRGCDTCGYGGGFLSGVEVQFNIKGEWALRWLPVSQDLNLGSFLQELFES